MWGSAVRYTQGVGQLRGQGGGEPYCPTTWRPRSNGVIASMLDFKGRLRRQLVGSWPTARRRPASCGCCTSCKDALQAQAGKARRNRAAGQGWRRLTRNKPGASSSARHQQAGAGQQRPGLQELRRRRRAAAAPSAWRPAARASTHTDFVLGAPLPIEWARVYRSQLDAFDRGQRWVRAGLRLTPPAWTLPTPPRASARAAELVYHGVDGRSHAYPVLAVGKCYRDADRGDHVTRLSQRLLAMDFGKPVPAARWPTGARSTNSCR